jgi:hypothetical protein
MFGRVAGGSDGEPNSGIRVVTYLNAHIKYVSETRLGSRLAHLELCVIVT